MLKKNTKIIKPKIKPLKEEDSQMAFVGWVDQNWRNWELDFFLMFSVPNERNSNSYHMAKLKKMGLCPGISDLVFIYAWGGLLRGLFLEMKTKKGVQSKNQKLFQKLIDSGQEIGFPLKYKVAKSFMEAKIIITKELIR